MDKYPYFTDEICINTTKPLVFVHFFILAQQTSLHNGEGETVSYSSPFPCFLQEDWQIKCNLFYLNLFKVIPIKSGYGHFGQNQNKKIISRYVNKSFSFSYYLDSSWKGKLYTKIQSLRIQHILSNLQHCFLPFLTCFA